MPTLPVTRSANDKLSRRKRPTIAASSADVKNVNPAVGRTGALNAPKGAFETTVGIGAEEVAPAVISVSDRLKAAETKQQSRKDAHALAQSTNRYRKEVEGLFTQFTDERDPSNEDDLNDHGRGLEVAKQAVLSEFSGSEDARARLEEKLELIKGDAISQGGKESNRIIKANVDEAYNADIAPFLSDMSKDTSIESFRLNTASIKLAATDYKGSWDPLEEKVRVQQAIDKGAEAQLDSLILQGDLEGAGALLEGMEGTISGDFLGKQVQRIKQVEAKKKSIAFEAALAGAIQDAKNNSDMKLMNAVLKDSGVPPLNQGGVMPAQVLAPFDDGSEPSGDMQRVNSMMAVAQKLALVGKTSEASHFMQKAKFLMANSPEIQNAKELDKVLTPAALAVFDKDLPAGTTMRDVLGLVPPSLEQKSRDKARGTARGKAQVEGEEQIAFIGEAEGIINNVLEEITISPSKFGAVGALQATGQTALGVISDLGGKNFIDSVRDMALTESEAGFSKVEEWIDDPTLATLSVMENSLGLILARLQTPSGQRIPVAVIERSIADVGLTGLKSSSQVKNRMEFILKRLQGRADSVKRRFGLDDPGVNPEADDDPLFELKDGVLVEVEED